jgi:hypothetical protein
VSIERVVHSRVGTEFELKAQIDPTLGHLHSPYPCSAILHSLQNPNILF